MLTYEVVQLVKLLRPVGYISDTIMLLIDHFHPKIFIFMAYSSFFLIAIEWFKYIRCMLKIPTTHYNYNFLNDANFE